MAESVIFCSSSATTGQFILSRQDFVNLYSKRVTRIERDSFFSEITGSTREFLGPGPTWTGKHVPVS